MRKSNPNLPTCTLNEMLFPVEMASISEKLGLDTISSTEFGIFAQIGGKEMLLNTCSDNYELIPNANIFLEIERILNAGGIKFKVEYGMYQFSRFYADYTIEVGGISVGNSTDLIFPVLRVEHSYNGLWKYKMTFGYFRLICSNGLVVPVEGQEESNITIVGKHTAKITESLKRLMEKIQFFTSNNKKFSEKFEIVADRWVKNWEDRVLEVINATGVGLRGAKFNEKTNQYEGQIFDRIREEASVLTNGKVNDWLIYNGINYNIYNGTTSEGKPYETAINLRRDADRKVWDTIYKFPNSVPQPKKKVVTAE